MLNNGDFHKHQDPPMADELCTKATDALPDMSKFLLVPPGAGHCSNIISSNESTYYLGFWLL